MQAHSGMRFRGRYYSYVNEAQRERSRLEFGAVSAHT